MTTNASSGGALGARLFSFGVITDTHLNQAEAECSSPFEVNMLANGRMRHVIRDLNARDLAFVINVGDLIHPVPALPDLYAAAAARFHEQVAELEHDLYLTPGNHDIGDKPNDWAPVAGICDDYIALWEKHFGAQYQSFDHAGCHFIIINAQIINSGLAAEAEQRAWLEADLEANRGRRIFMHSHYPPYFTRPGEEENYDNIGEPGRTWMLDLLEAYQVEALLIGHVHNFWYNLYADTDCYLLPSTAFVRQDYAEMYRIAPGPDDEAGRNDRPKLGYFVVHVHEGGHLCEVVRTYGETAEAGDGGGDGPRSSPVGFIHPHLNARVPLGFDMRQNWMEQVEIPPTGGLDEFDRKEVRNDYPLMACWEMGIRKLRVPYRDLMVADNVERMRTLKRHGHEFTLFTFGDPDARARQLILENQDIFSAWEIGVNWDVLERVVGGIGEVARQTEIPVYLTRLRSIDELRAEAGRYYHVINQGFLADDAAQMRGLLARDELAGAVAGFVFRLTLDAEPWRTIETAAGLAADMGVGASVHLRMCGGNPAEATTDDLLSANRLAEAMAAATLTENLCVFADTFADFDRGYLVRNGVVDRLCNPRLGFHVVKHLNAWLNGGDPAPRPTGLEAAPGARVVAFEAGPRLVLPEAPLASLEIAGSAEARPREYIDLGSGQVRPLGAVSDAGEGMRVDFAETVSAPVLLR